MTKGLIAPKPLARFTAQPSGQFYQADESGIINAVDADEASLVFQGCRLFLPRAITIADLWFPPITPPTETAFGHALVDGAAAGDLTAPGITEADTLDSVIQYIGAGTAVTDVVDLTAEFSITADDTINNDGGTDTTGSKLVVNWHGPAS